MLESVKNRLFCYPGFRERLTIMNAEILAVVEFWEKEKGISRQVLLGAVQEALLSAAKKAVGPARELRCSIDPKSGDIKAYARLMVSERVISKHDQISVFDARRIQRVPVPFRLDQREKTHSLELAHRPTKAMRNPRSGNWATRP